ncbi:hypothetical protein Avbf_16240 [Armadillidium vulgare]|nr:Dihydrofolate reductase [Armadillidium vulgare]RXG63419.1 hypothetical protein Avbf_16240 [Armadillidium vulgare]
MKHFTKMTKTTEDSTKKNAVIMGRNTWQSIPEKFRPLPGRINILVSTQATKEPDKFEGAVVCDSLPKAIEIAESRSNEIEKLWVIGGSSLYKAAFESEWIHRIYLTKILKDFECDTFLPQIEYDCYKLIDDPSVPNGVQEEGDVKYRYEVYEKITNASQ